MGEYRIRAARVDDVPAIHELIRGLAEYERLVHEMIATEEDLGRALFGDRPVAEAIVAEGEAGGEAESPQRMAALAGFALFFHNYSTFAGRAGIYLEDLFVRPELRGRGIGAALLRTLARIAVERGCRRLEWSVLDWNEPALGFYRRLGAVPLSDWTVQRVTGEALARLAADAPEL